MPIPNYVKDDGLGHWLPWNQTFPTVMRKIGNPVAGYTKDVSLDIPTVEQPCGYDLEAGDWVVPWGKGQTSDLVLTLKRQYQDYANFDVSVDLSFSNSGDGIQVTQLPKEFANSYFKWPRQAPETGYQSVLKLRFSEKTGTPVERFAVPTEVYFFRIRTVKQGDKIISALYGKISAGLQISPMKAKNCYIRFYYHLNPTSLDQNMEFDPAKNLFKNLPSDQQPREP